MINCLLIKKNFAHHTRAIQNRRPVDNKTLCKLKKLHEIDEIGCITKWSEPFSLMALKYGLKVMDKEEYDSNIEIIKKYNTLVYHFNQRIDKLNVILELYFEVTGQHCGRCNDKCKGHKHLIYMTYRELLKILQDLNILYESKPLIIGQYIEKARIISMINKIKEYIKKITLRLPYCENKIYCPELLEIEMMYIGNNDSYPFMDYFRHIAKLLQDSAFPPGLIDTNMPIIPDPTKDELEEKERRYKQEQERRYKQKQEQEQEQDQEQGQGA